MQMNRSQAVMWLFFSCTIAMLLISRLQKIELVEVKTRHPNLEIYLVFPVFKNLRNAEFERELNTRIQDYIKSVVNEARMEASQNAQYFENAHFELEIKTEVHEPFRNVLSVALYVYKFTGGAHGTSDLRTFTTDLNDERLLAICDFFELGREELEDRLRSLILNRISDCKERYFPWAEDYVKEDSIFARPFVVTERGIGIFYEEGEIAPRGHGITCLDFTWDELNGCNVARKKSIASGGE